MAERTNAAERAKEAVSIIGLHRALRKARRDMAVKIAKAEVELEKAKLKDDQDYLDFLVAETKATGTKADIDARLQ